MKLLIRNLSRITTEQEITELFKKFGAVQSCNLVIDKTTGKSKGFAFVEMPRPGDAKAAVKTLNGNTLAGNTIRVKKAATKKEIASDPIKEKAAGNDSDTKTENPAETKASTVTTAKTKQIYKAPQNNNTQQTTNSNKSGNINRNIWSSK